MQGPSATQFSFVVGEVSGTLWISAQIWKTPQNQRFVTPSTTLSSTHAKSCPCRLVHLFRDFEVDLFQGSPRMELLSSFICTSGKQTLSFAHDD